MLKRFTILFFGIFLMGCATYYQKNMEFQTHVTSGELDKAENLLEKNKQIQRDRNRLLFLLNMGFLKHMQQEFDASNEFFNQADLMVEDYRTNYASEALALISNPQVRPYRIEDFELVMIHYYKALNYLNLGQYDGARVEAKRMNLILNQLNDKYKDHKNRYQADAFAHIIMGLSFEATGDLNDAFIAYRNAYEVYTGEHGYFDIKVPVQLKEDLLRTSFKLGFQNDYLNYKEQFGMTYEPSNAAKGEVVFFWQNGMGPVKDEWSINFFATPGGAGFVVFENEELGLSFPFYVGDDKEKRNDLMALKVIRVAFPKYLERPVLFEQAVIEGNGKSYGLDKAQDINAIAFKTLQDRFLREMGTSLLRLGLKKAAEIKLSQENEALGAVATIANAATEKADTRNWQTLPHTIYYKRIPLIEGTNEFTFKAKSGKGITSEETFTFEGKEGRMYFMPYHTMQHLPAASWDRASIVGSR